MKNLNNILSLGAGAILLLSSCSTSYNAMRGGENDDLYFMASDARVATEFAVNNNNPQTFQSLNSVSSTEFDQENFSSRNVNPEYIARYQTQTATEDSGTVYFDDNEVQATPNVNVYNNFYGSGAGLPGGGFGASRFNLNLGFGFGSPMWGWGAPMMGWGMPMMGGFYDPFWDPFWGSSFGWGMRPGFGWGMRPSFGWGMGWNSMWGMNMGFGWGMGGMWGNPWMGGMYGWGMRPGFGWGSPIFVLPGGENNRQIVRGARPGRGATSAIAGSRGTMPSSTAATTRAARREAATEGRGISQTTRTAGRDFSTSQNEYTSGRSRVANTSANPGYRNTGSAAATRPSSRTGIANTRPAYSTTPNTRNSYATPSRSNTGTINRGNTRTTSPSYNRNTGGTYNNTRTAPTRSTMPSRSGGMTTPSRSGGSTMSAPSRSSGGGFSTGGMSGGGSRGGGGGAVSSGGSRGGRGN